MRTLPPVGTCHLIKCQKADRMFLSVWIKISLTTDCLGEGLTHLLLTVRAPSWTHWGVPTQCFGPPHIKDSVWRMLIFAQVHLGGLPLRTQTALSIKIHRRPERRLELLSLWVCVRTERTTHMNPLRLRPPTQTPPAHSLHLNPPGPSLSFLLCGLLTLWGWPTIGGTWTGQLGTTGALSHPQSPPASSTPWPLHCLWTSVAWYQGRSFLLRRCIFTQHWNK